MMVIDNVVHDYDEFMMMMVVCAIGLMLKGLSFVAFFVVVITWYIGPFWLNVDWECGKEMILIAIDRKIES